MLFYMHPPVPFNFSFLIWTLVCHKQMSLFMTNGPVICTQLQIFTTEDSPVLSVFYYVSQPLRRCCNGNWRN